MAAPNIRQYNHRNANKCSRGQNVDMHRLPFVCGAPRLVSPCFFYVAQHSIYTEAKCIPMHDAGPMRQFNVRPKDIIFYLIQTQLIYFHVFGVRLSQERNTCICNIMCAVCSVLMYYKAIYIKYVSLLPPVTLHRSLFGIWRGGARAFEARGRTLAHTVRSRARANPISNI